FRLSPVPALGGAVLALLVLAFVAWIVWRKPKEQEPQIAAAPSPVVQPSPSSMPAAVTPEPVSVIAQLNDGERVLTLDQQGKLSGADDLPPAYKELVTKALRTQRIERSSQLQGLSRPPSALMGSDNQPDQFAVIEPVGSVLLSNQPRFRWSTLA